VLVEAGATKVLCTAMVEQGVPRFLLNSNQGWVTAEYAMLPGSTPSRKQRETGVNIDGRSVEIRRLIGRAMRAAINLKAFVGHTIWLDCDVLQADGGTRTASITGAYVALADAVAWMRQKKLVRSEPLTGMVAAVSVGIVGGTSPSRDTRRGDTPPTVSHADWRDVTLVRLFPLTEPERWISLVEMNGKEVGILKDASRLGHDALRLARDELRRRYLVPRITRILACRPRADLVEWTVESDRGQQKFLTRDLREQIKEHMPTRLSIVDLEGNRYDIPDLAALDPESRRRLDAQL
jgi:hypothetical protein